MPKHTRPLSDDEMALMAPVFRRRERAQARADHIADEIRTADVALAAMVNMAHEGAALVQMPDGRPGISWETPETPEGDG